MKKIILGVVIVLSTIVVIITVDLFREQINYRATENRIEQLEIEINRADTLVSKEQVDNILGQDKIDVSSGGSDEKKIIISKCGDIYEQYYYKGNGSLLSGRWDDTIIVYFYKNDACYFKRYGLGPNWSWFR